MTKWNFSGATDVTDTPINFIIIYLMFSSFSKKGEVLWKVCDVVHNEFQYLESKCYKSNKREKITNLFSLSIYVCVLCTNALADQRAIMYSSLINTIQILRKVCCASASPNFP